MNEIFHPIDCHVICLGQCAQQHRPRARNYSKMVNNYKRTSNRNSWDEANMKNAIEKVISKEMGLNKASAEFNVPKTTLKRRLQKYVTTKDIDKATEKKLGRFEQVFSKEQELELALYAKDMESRFFGLTTKDMRILAYDLAEKNNISHNFDRSTKMAGRIWLEHFLKRNSDLSLRKPEATSAARASGFNQVSVNKFFDLLEQTIETHQLTPDRIFNVDETGMTTVPKTMPKIIGAKGKKQIGLLTSAERGQLVTVVFCVGADGSYMPPLFIFPRKRMKPELMINAPRGSWAECHESGWIQKDIFTSWFRKFIVFSRASKDNPVLLILDGHASHTKNLDIIELGREHGVHILATPPHCTHRLQPLDVGFMKPLSTYYTEAAQNWLKTNCGRIVTQFQIPELVDKAFQKAATMSTAFNAFRATGIWPLNREIFTEADFLAAAATDIECSSSVPFTSEAFQEANDSDRTSILDESHPNTPPSMSLTASSTLDIGIVDDSQPSTSMTTNNIVKNSTFIVGPKDIMPIPKTTKTKRANIRRGKTAIITSSPYRLELETTQNKKADQVKKGLFTDDKTPKKRKIATKGKNSQVEKKKKKTTKNKKNIVQRSSKGKASKKSDIKSTKKNRSDSSSDDDDVECFYCGHLYSESTDGWVQCQNCQSWAHCACAGIDDEVQFVCENCSN